MAPLFRVAGPLLVILEAQNIINLSGFYITQGLGINREELLSPDQAGDPFTEVKKSHLLSIYSTKT